MNHLFKLIKMITSTNIPVAAFFFFMPLHLLSQKSGVENLSGTLLIDEKPVDFNYLSMPDGSTNIPFYSHLPTSVEFMQDFGIEYLSLSGVHSIEMIRFTEDEQEFIRKYCSDCTIYKARISFSSDPASRESEIYLAVPHLFWMNTASEEYNKLRAVEVKYIDKIEFKQ